MNKKVDGHDKYAYSSKTTKVLISIAHCVVKQPNMKPHSFPLQSSASSSSCCSKLPSVILLWVVVTGDNDSVRELPPRETELCCLAVAAIGKLNKHLATTWNFDSWNRSRDLYGLHLAKLAALLPDIFQDVLVFFLIHELFFDDHVEKTENLSWLTRTCHACHSRHLYLSRDIGHGHSFGSNTRALHDQLLVSQLHSIEPCDGLVCDTSIKILRKCITLGETRSDVLDKVECLQLAERGEQLFHLLLVEIVGEATNKHLLQGVRNNSADHPWHAGESIHTTPARDWLIIMRATQFEGLALEVDAVECHRLSCFVDASALEEGKILVSVDVTRQYWIAFGLCQPTEMHLLVEEVNHLLFTEPEGNIAHINPSGLACH